MSYNWSIWNSAKTRIWPNGCVYTCTCTCTHVCTYMYIHVCAFSSKGRLRVFLCFTELVLLPNNIQYTTSRVVVSRYCLIQIRSVVCSPPAHTLCQCVSVTWWECWALRLSRTPPRWRLTSVHRWQRGKGTVDFRCIQTLCSVLWANCNTCNLRLSTFALSYT